jgi:GT2 family glycosyltransferase
MMPVDSAPATVRPSARRRSSPGLKAQARDEGPIEVSVCIANWNCRDLLRACLESLHDQPQGVRLEAIVVDNGSHDGAADMVDREFPEVILCRNPINQGFARANNQAADRARGRYLFFLNNDTELPPWTLGKLVHYAESHPEVGLLGPRLCGARGEPQVSFRQRPTLAALLHRLYLVRWTGLLRGAYKRYRREDFDPHSIRSVEVLMGAAMLMPREVFFNCGRWDEGFTFGGEDIDLSTRVARHHAVVFLPSVEITHYGRVSTRQNICYTSTNVAAGFAHFLRKAGYSRATLLLYKLLVSLDAPVNIVVKALEFLWRRYRGDQDKAEKSLLSLRGAGHFLLKGLIPFWKA